MIQFLKRTCREFAEFVDKNTTCCQSCVPEKKEFLLPEVRSDVLSVNLIELLDEYQFESVKTFNPDLAANPQEAIKYLGLKLSEEIGEINGPIAKHYYHGKALDVENLVEEIGDSLWYLANLANTLGFKLSDVATKNIEKLRKRHGEKYKKEHYVPKH